MSTTSTSSHTGTCETQSSTVQARIHHTHARTCAYARTHACTHPHAHALLGTHTSRHSHRRESAPLCDSVRWHARTATGAISPAHVQHTLHAIHPLWRGRHVSPAASLGLKGFDSRTQRSGLGADTTARVPRFALQIRARFCCCAASPGGDPRHSDILPRGTPRAREDAVLRA